MVPNDADKDACVCCETPKPGAAPKKAAVSAFDNPSKANAAFAVSSGGGGFNFGSGAAPSTGGAGGGFTFGGGGGGGKANTR